MESECKNKHVGVRGSQKIISTRPVMTRVSKFFIVNFMITTLVFYLGSDSLLAQGTSGQVDSSPSSLVAQSGSTGSLEGAPSQGSLPGIGTIPGVDDGGAPQALEGDFPDAFGNNLYDPSGRRDPFNALVKGSGSGNTPDASLPPLQRPALTELSLIGIIWGGFGYTAMVQTPDGKGYAVRRGTKMGSSEGIVTSITETGIVVTERFRDVYGFKQEREYVMVLHIQEELE